MLWLFRIIQCHARETVCILKTFSGMCNLWWHFLWKSLLNNAHVRSVSLTPLVLLKHSPLLSMVSSILYLSAVSFFGTIFLSLSFFLSSLASSFSLFLFYFSWNKSFHAVHAITNGNLSVLLLIFLLGVFGQCKTPWRGEMCLPLTLTLLTWRIWWASNNASKWQTGFNSVFKGLSLFSDPVCMFVLAPGFSSSVWSNLCHIKNKHLFVSLCS